MKKYNELDCLRSLNKKRDCVISGKVIKVSKDNGDVGKKSWNKISYLCKVHGYRYMIISFTGGAAKKDKKRYNEDYDAPKPNGKNGKLNLKAMVEKIMGI